MAAGMSSLMSRSVRSVLVSLVSTWPVMCLRLSLTSCRKSSSVLMASVYQELTFT